MQRAPEIEADAATFGPRIDLCVCTFRRPQVIETLRSLCKITIPDGLDVRILVSDNDDEPSARDAVTEFARSARLPVEYVHSPKRNISIARNALLERSDADWIGYIDDDETADPDLLVGYQDCWKRTNADGMFGIVEPRFPPEAPDWLSRLNLHVPGPHRRDGIVETGPSGNVLLRWRNTPWVTERFQLSRGRSGGEDTEFFFRLGRMGARYEIAEGARAFAPVAPDRLSMRWLVQRRFRAGQSYSARSVTTSGRAALILKALAKSALSIAMVIPMSFSPVGWRYWFLRSCFHGGVVAGCLRLREPEIYG